MGQNNSTNDKKVSKVNEPTPAGTSPSTYIPTTTTGRMTNHQALPNSIEAEVCVLGAMILDANTIDTVVHITQSEDFFRPSHKIIYDTLCQMHDSGKPIDLVALNEELRRKNLLDNVGGMEYLAALVEGVPSTANVEYYARTVRDKALLRNLIAVNQQIIRQAYEDRDEPAEILDQAEYSIFQIASRQIGDNAQSLETLLQQTFETLQSADGSTITGVATGYYKLDELTAGFQNGDMVVIAGRP